MKRIISAVLSCIIAFSIIGIGATQAFADSKPAATQITSLKAGEKSFTVKWEKKSVDGYQIMYSTSSEFKDSKKKTINDGSKTSKKVSDLKGNKKYYVKVRTFKLKDDEKKYSSWSKVKNVTTKKATSKSSTKSKAKTGNIVYITPTGKKYHYSKDCAGKNAIETDLASAKKSYDPCKKCANG